MRWFTSLSKIAPGPDTWSCLFSTITPFALTATFDSGTGLTSEYPAFLGWFAQPVQVGVALYDGVADIHQDDFVPFVFAVFANPVRV